MKRLVVCTDGSAYGLEACRYASWLSKKSGAEILTLYVSDLRQFEVPVVADVTGSFGLQPYQEITSQIEKVEEKRAEAIRRASLSVFEEEAVADRASFLHRIGILGETVNELHEEGDLVVMGKRGENANFETEHLGSSLERVIRSSSAPVWVTSRKFRPIRRILFAYDGGGSCRKALHFIANAGWIGDLDLHLVSVTDAKSEAERSGDLMEAGEVLSQHGHSFESLLLEGDVEETIADYVKSHSIDMMVMGAYGHSRIRYLLIGSTTTAMIRICQIPVLCFR